MGLEEHILPIRKKPNPDDDPGIKLFRMGAEAKYKQFLEDAEKNHEAFMNKYKGQPCPPLG